MRDRYLFIGLALFLMLLIDSSICSAALLGVNKVNLEFTDVLKRHKNDSQGGKWGFPGVGVEPGETWAQAAIREVYEETGLSLDEKEIEDMGFFNHTIPGKHYEYKLFRFLPKKFIEPKLQEGHHDEYIWIKPAETSTIPLVYPDWFQKVFKKVYGVQT